MEHCLKAPPSASNCMVQTHDLHYVDSWKGDETRSEEKARHEALLAKIQLSPEHEEYNLCRIGNYFYYSLNSENEERVGGVEIIGYISMCWYFGVSFAKTCFVQTLFLNKASKNI